MMPLIILLTCFALLLITNKLMLKGPLSLSHIGRISLAIMLLFTGISHFLKTKLMIEMMPAFFPLKKEMVYFTGLLEAIASIGLLTKNYSKLTSIMLIIFFLAILPANIIGSIKE